MWINKTKQLEEESFLLARGKTLDEREADFNKRFINPVINWANANPESTVYLWIDTAMAALKAIEKAKQNIEISLKKTAGKVIFRDVRQLPIVRETADAFSEVIPIYFRVDLLRAIIADHVLSTKEHTYFVYGDLDMSPLSSTELFDKRTMTILNDYGFIFAGKGIPYYENGFQIFNGNHSTFLSSHKRTVITPCLEIAIASPHTLYEQHVYQTYPAMLVDFLHHDGRYGKIYPIEPFPISESIKDSRDLRDYPDRLLSLKNLEKPKLMPTKPVMLPPTHFGSLSEKRGYGD